MIRKKHERFAYTCPINANDYVVVGECDNCNGEFLFAAIKTRPNGQVDALAGEYFQFDLVKFCPYCGARNVKPRPVAHKDA